MTSVEPMIEAEEPDTGDGAGDKPRSLRRDAWRELRHRPLFWISVTLLVLFTVMAIWPGLFTDTDPRACELSKTRQGPSSSAWFGYDNNGCDIFSRTLHGARASMAVGVCATAAVLVFGGIVGTLAAYYRRWVDALISRIGDIFFGLPLLLGGILLMTSFPNTTETPAWLAIGKVVFALTLFGWPEIMRLMRSSVLQVSQFDYVQAGRALGASGPRIIRKHIVPNAISPVIVVCTIRLGAFIVAEAALSFLGIGLPGSISSWGVMIDDAQDYVRSTPHMLLFPAAALSLCVLSFIMLGDAIRDAFDPKLR